MAIPERGQEDNKYSSILLRDIIDYMREEDNSMFNDSEKQNLSTGTSEYSITEYGRDFKILLSTKCETINKNIRQIEREVKQRKKTFDCIVIDFDDECFNRFFFKSVLDFVNDKTIILLSDNPSSVDRGDNKKIIIPPQSYTDIDAKSLINIITAELIEPKIRFVIPSHLDLEKDNIIDFISGPLNEIGLEEFDFLVIGTHDDPPEVISYNNQWEKSEKIFYIFHLDNQPPDKYYAQAISQANLHRSFFTHFAFSPEEANKRIIKESYNQVIKDLRKSKKIEIDNSSMMDPILKPNNFEFQGLDFWKKLNHKIEQELDFKGNLYGRSTNEIRQTLIPILKKKDTFIKKRENKMKFDIFISHASEDKSSIAIPIHEACEKIGLKSFLDKDSIKWGDSITGKINQALGSSTFFLAILSEESVKKYWTTKEITSALMMEEGGQMKILPLVVDNPDLSTLSLLADKMRLTWNNNAAEIAKEIKNLT